MAEVVYMPFASYLAVINNSVGSGTWRQNYALVDGVKTDIVNQGELSCAFFVSSILRMFDQVDTVHANVASTLSDLQRNGWIKVDEPQPGDVLVWGPKPGGEKHDHIGFYIGDERAVSNDYRLAEPAAGGRPAQHHWLFAGHPDGERALLGIYRSDDFASA